MSDKQTTQETAGSPEQDATRHAQDDLSATSAPEMPDEQAPAEAPASDAGTGDATDPQVRMTELEKQLEKVREEAEASRDQLVRTLADMDNLRKRTARDLENAHKYALERFTMELLPVRDSLELGLGASQGDGADIAKLREGIELTLKMLTAAFEKHGIVEVAPDGEKFNPDLHQAMATQPSREVDPDHVLTVYQKGYTLNDRLLRPALVIVSAAPPPVDAGGT